MQTLINEIKEKQRTAKAYRTVDGRRSPVGTGIAHVCTEALRELEIMQDNGTPYPDRELSLWLIARAEEAAEMIAQATSTKDHELSTEMRARRTAIFDIMVLNTHAAARYQKAAARNFAEAALAIWELASTTRDWPEIFGVREARLIEAQGEKYNEIANLPATHELGRVQALMRYLDTSMMTSLLHAIEMK